MVHDRYDIIFCHPPAGRSLNDRVAKLVAQKPPHKRCYARAPNRTRPIVTNLLLNASEVRSLKIDALPKHPTFWVPLRFATKADALTAICTFANVTVPLLQRADHVASYTLLTLPTTTPLPSDVGRCDATTPSARPGTGAYAKHGRARLRPSVA